MANAPAQAVQDPPARVGEISPPLPEGATGAPVPGRRRPRLALEITVVLLVKLLLLYAIWVAWFAQPASRELDGRSVAARLLGANPTLPAAQAATHR
jgi:hypothetical protein